MARQHLPHHQQHNANTVKDGLSSACLTHQVRDLLQQFSAPTRVVVWVTDRFCVAKQVLLLKLCSVCG
eukprot:4198413-Amphidinium_carterae.1